MQLLLAITLTHALATTSPARTEHHDEASAETCSPPGISLQGPVHDVAATPSLLAALRTNELVLLDGCGRMLARRARPDNPHDSSRADRVLIAGGRAWALLSGSVYRQDELQLVRLPGRSNAELLAVSPEGGLAVAAAGHALFAATENRAAFTPLAELPLRPHAVVVNGGGEIFIADARGVWRVGMAGAELILSGEFSDLAWCGGALMALGPGSIWAFASNRSGWRRAPAPIGFGLRCGSIRHRWLAVLGGEKLWLTHDAGLSWLALDNPTVARGAAITDEGSLWVAAPEGLVHVALTQVPADTSTRDAVPHAGWSRWSHPPLPPQWLTLLPRLDVYLSVTTSESRQDVQGWLWLSWPIPTVPRTRTVTSRPSQREAPERPDENEESVPTGDSIDLPQPRETPL